MPLFRVLSSRTNLPSPAALAGRLTSLYVGLAVFGASTGLMVRAGLGLAPWDVLHQGIAGHTGLSIGTVSIIAGACVLALWWPLRQRPGLGTVSNVFVVGLAMNATLHFVPVVHALGVRIPLLAGAIVLNGMASGLYISARFGPGPRDGLMTGLHQRTGRSIRLARTVIEVTVLISGILLGGSFGAGTVAYALFIGPLVQIFLRVFTWSAKAAASSVAGEQAGGEGEGVSGERLPVPGSESGERLPAAGSESEEQLPVPASGEPRPTPVQCAGE